MNCFNNNRPNLTSSDRTANINARTLYKSNVRSFQQNSTRRKCNNYNGKVGFYTNGLLRNTRSFNTKNLLQKGYSLCVDGAFSRKCTKQPNLEKDDQIGNRLQRGLFSCPQSDYLSYQPTKLTMGRDSIYNQFLGSSLDSAIGCNPLSGFRSMESWPLTFQAKQEGDPPWDNYFGVIPRERWDIQEPKINNSDPSGNSPYPVGQVIIDPDNNLFGTEFCPSRVTSGEGPLKYLQFTRATAYSIVQGQVFDPTGEQYGGGDIPPPAEAGLTGSWKYGKCCSWLYTGNTGTTGHTGTLPMCTQTLLPPNRKWGQALPCDFEGICDCAGNQIRLPRRGDLAIAGLNSLLDINSNISQCEHFTDEFFMSGWMIGKKSPSPFANLYIEPDVDDAFGLYELGRAATQKFGPEPSQEEIKNSLGRFVRGYRRFLVTMSWAFQWFTGVGIVDSVCCIDKEKKIFRIIVKTFWGDMFPPELLPASEELALDQLVGTTTITANGATWRGLKAAPQGLKFKIGGIHQKGTPEDLVRMSQNIAQFPGMEWTGMLNDFKGIVGLTLHEPGGPQRAPPGQAGDVKNLCNDPVYHDYAGATTATVEKMPQINFRAPAFPPGFTSSEVAPAVSWETAFGVAASDLNPPSALGGGFLSKYIINKPDLPQYYPWITELPPSNIKNKYKIPSTWNKVSVRTSAVLMWTLSPELFAGYKPGPISDPQVLRWGGGIGFVGQNQLNSYFKRLMGTGFAPVSIMGWQNCGPLRWGSVEDGSGNMDCSNNNTDASMARNAMLLAAKTYTPVTTTLAPGGAQLEKGQFSSALRKKDGLGATNGPTQQGEDAYGAYVLQFLERRPYSIQRASGECGSRNLAFGNKTRQNYLVSYDKKAGNINFAVNQKLYTNFAYKQVG